MNICGIGNLRCVIQAEKRLQLGDLKRKLNSHEKKANLSRRYFGDHLEDCNCMPMCSDLSYHAETSQSYWKWEDDLRTYTKNGSLGFNGNE